MDKIYIIIPFFYGWPQTKLCLDALRASTYRNLEVIVVNHSTDDEIRKTLPAQYPEVLQILGSPTLWWAGATNLGIRAALSQGAKKIMLLNHDCYFEPETIQRLAAHAEQTPGALIAPVPFDYATRQVLAVTSTTCFLLGFPTLAPPGKIRYLGQRRLLPTGLILGGRGVLIPSGAFERVGLLDEVNLPGYYADFDFFLRCRSRGIPLFIAADAKVYVDDTQTTLARGLEKMSFRDFLETLRVPRSHRNIRDLTAIFKHHYPIKGLHYLGVALNLARYFAAYALKRLRRSVSNFTGNFLSQKR